MKRNLLILAALLLLACVGGAAYMQNAKKEEVRSFIDGLPGTLAAERIDVPLFGNRIEIHNLSGLFMFFEEAPYEIRAESLILEGVNRKAARSNGTVKLADRVRIKNYSLISKGGNVPLLWKEVECEESDTHGIWMDMNAFKALKAPRGEEFIRAMLSMRWGPSTSGKSRFSWLSARGRFGPGAGGNLCTMITGSGESDGYSLLELGKGAFTDVTLTEEGVYFARAGEWRFASGKNPRAVYSAMTEGEIGPEEALILLPKMMEEGYALRGMEARDLEIAIEGVPGVIRAARLDADIALGAKEITCRIAGDSLLVPSTVLSALRPELAFLQKPVPVLDLRLLFDLGTHIESPDKGSIRAALELDEPTLGSWNASFSLGGRPFVGPGAYIPLDVSTIGFAGATNLVSDRGFLGLLFADRPGDEPGTGAARRAATAARIRAAAGFEREVPPEIFEKAADFIEQSGTYENRVTVAAPLSFMNFILFGSRDLKSLHFEAAHRPPQ